MAESSSCSNELSVLNSSKSLNLKERYFKAIDWNITEWIEAGLNDSKFHRLVNSTKYWRKKLLEAFDDCNVILTLHAEASSKFLNPQQIVSNIEAQFPGVLIPSYNRFRNPRYLAIDFQTTDMRDHVLKHLTQIENFEVLFLSWAPVNNHVNIRVHWLPKKVPITKVSTALNLYFTLKFVRMDTALHANGRQYGCGIFVFEGQLKPGVVLAQVPHTMMISGLEALITMPIRPPLCLQCDTVGHKAADCPVSFCRQCKKRLPKEHECRVVELQPPSYAQKLVGELPLQEEENDYDFETLQQVSHEEFARACTPVKGASTDQPSIENLNLVKRILKINEELNSSALNLPDGKEISGFPDLVKKPPLEEHLASLRSTDTNKMDFTEEVGLPAAKADPEDYITVQRRGKTSKNKETRDRDKLSKVPVVTAPYVVRPASKPVTRSGASAFALPKQENKRLQGNSVPNN